MAESTVDPALLEKAREWIGLHIGAWAAINETVTSLAQTLADTDAAARGEEREACAKAVCRACAEGWPLVRPDKHTVPSYGTEAMHRTSCRAYSIRARTATTGAGEEK